MHLAERHGLAVTAGRARLNRGFLLGPGDPREALANDRLGLAEARRLGQRTWSDVFLTNAAFGARWTGDWDWALGELEELLAGDLERETRISALTMTIQIQALRGAPVAELLAEAERLAGDALDRQILTGVLGSRAATILVRGELLPAAEAYRRAAVLTPGSTLDYIDLAARAAIRAGDAASAAADLASIEATGLRGPAIDARRAAIQAGLAALEGRGADAIALYRDANRRFRDAGLSLDEGLTAIEMATLLDPADPEVRAAIEAGRAMLEGLGARPFVEQLDAAVAHSMDAEGPRHPVQRRSTSVIEVAGTQGATGASS
jgi:hypothetical protein